MPLGDSVAGGYRNLRNVGVHAKKIVYVFLAQEVLHDEFSAITKNK